MFGFLEDFKNVILQMLDNKQNFSNALKNYLLTNVREKSDLKKIEEGYLIFFNKYYYFEALETELLNKKTNLLISALASAIIGVSNFKISVDEAEEFLKEIFKNNKEKYTDEIENCLLKAKKSEYPEIIDIKKGSFEHLSIILNLPSWFIKMIISQYGKEQAKDIFLSFKAKHKNIYIQNHLEDLAGKDIDEVNNFKNNGENIYTLQGKENKLVKDFTFVPTEYFYEKIIKSLPKMNNRYLTFYLGEQSYFYFNFLNKYLFKDNVINFAIKSVNENKETILKITPHRSSKLFVYESNENEMIARLFEKQDLLMLFSKSTNIKKFYDCPEYRVFINPLDIDLLINEQRTALKELSRHVIEDGYLIYAVNTINKKETVNIISAFLKNNEEFKLIKEELLLANKEYPSLGYYAIMKRNSND